MADNIKLIKKIQAQDGAYQIAASHYIDGTALDDRYVKPTDISSAMVFRGTLGTGGTKDTLPTAAEGTEGDAYKVITAGTYANGESATIGDMYVCAKYAEGSDSASYKWVLIPSGDDEYKGTVTTVTAGAGLKVGSNNSGGSITTTGTIGHINSVTAGTASGSATKTLTFGGTFAIPTVTYDAQGHITATSTTTMTMPANPDTNTSHNHSAGVGLTGSGSAGTGSGTYTYKAKLKSETALTTDSSVVASVSKIYPVITDKSGYLVVGLPDHNHSVKHTPAGSVGNNTTGISASFSGTAANHNHGFTGTETNTGGPVKASTDGDQSIGVLTSVTSNGSVSLSGGSVSLSGGSVSLSGGSVSLSGGAVTATVDGDGVLSFGHTNPTATLTNPTASLTRPTASLTLPTVNYTAPTFGSGSAASTVHKHAVTATGTVGNKSITPAGSITITDSGHTHSFTGTEATITSGNQSA